MTKTTQAMKAIKINRSQEQIAALDTYISAVNGKAKAHTADHWAAIDAAEDAERMLNSAKVARTKRVGTVAIFKSAGPSARAYKYQSITSCFTLQRFAEGWRLMKAETVRTHPGSGTSLRLTISQHVADQIIKHAMDGFSVKLAA